MSSPVWPTNHLSYAKLHAQLIFARFEREFKEHWYHSGGIVEDDSSPGICVNRVYVTLMELEHYMLVICTSAL